MARRESRREAPPNRPLEHVPRRLHGRERVHAVDARIERCPHDVSLVRAANREPDDETVVAQAGELGQDGYIGQDAALERGRAYVARLLHRRSPGSAYG